MSAPFFFFFFSPPSNCRLYMIRAATVSWSVGWSLEAWPLPSTLSSCFSTGCTPSPHQVRQHQRSALLYNERKNSVCSIHNQGAALQQNARKCLFYCCFLSPLPALTCPQSLGSHSSGFAFFSVAGAREKVGKVCGSQRNYKARRMLAVKALPCYCRASRNKSS